MLARVRSASLRGVEGRPVDVEVHVSGGFPGFTMVGLPDAEVREARDRVRAALLTSGFSWPQCRVTVNLAPSGVPKGGPGLDLPIAIGLLVAQGEVPAKAIVDTAFVGELGLDGSVRAVPGLVCMVGCVESEQVVVAAAGAAEARLVLGSSARCVGSLGELVAVLRGELSWPAPPVATVAVGAPSPAGDLSDVRGQELGRRAVEVAAAGGHHLLLVGAPGCGKTMLAQRLPGLLPPLTRADALAVARVQSAAGLAVSDGGFPRRPPFRAPHHGATVASLTGGGSWLRPGEISLAHASLQKCYQSTGHGQTRRRQGTRARMSWTVAQTHDMDPESKALDGLVSHLRRAERRAPRHRVEHVWACGPRRGRTARAGHRAGRPGTAPVAGCGPWPFGQTHASRKWAAVLRE